MSDHPQPGMGPVELSPGRIAECLRAAGHDVAVESIDAEPIGTGQMAGSFRLALRYGGDPGPLPPTMVAKVPAGPPERRAISAGSYRTEVDFYRNVAPLLAARLPRCWAAVRDDTGEDFLLLLEDLAPRLQGDQIAGCSVAEARVAVRNLAGIHGPTWNRPELTGVLESVDPDQVAGTDGVFPLLTEMFLERHTGRLSAETAQMYGRFAPLVGRFLVDQPAATAVVHGDYRLDNLLFAPDAVDVAIVDWQTVSLGSAGRDLAFFLGTSLSVEARRAHEDELVADYHAALEAFGVDGYDLAACRRDYAFGMFQVPLVIMFGSAIAASTERGDEMFRAMAERGAVAMGDMGTLDMV